MAGKQKSGNFQCTLCDKVCKRAGGLTRHYNDMHSNHKDLGRASTNIYRKFHSTLNGEFLFTEYAFYFINWGSALATPCDEDGIDLQPGAQPTQPHPISNNDWLPFNSRAEFQLAEFLFTKSEMSAGKVDELMDIWAATVARHGEDPPFTNHRHLQAKIDSISLGHVPWQSFTCSYQGELPQITNPPDWMKKKHNVWFRDPRQVVHNILSNPDFNGQIDYIPFQEFGDGKRQWSDFMSGDWPWKQAVSSILYFRLHFQTYTIV